MPTFVAFVVASLLARIVYDALSPYGVMPLNLGLAAVTWVVSFSLSRYLVASLRPD